MYAREIIIIILSDKPCSIIWIIKTVPSRPIVVVNFPLFYLKAIYFKSLEFF